jgi:hypothetical protein
MKSVEARIGVLFRQIGHTVSGYITGDSSEYKLPETYVSLELNELPEETTLGELYIILAKLHDTEVNKKDLYTHFIRRISEGYNSLTPTEKEKMYGRDLKIGDKTVTISKDTIDMPYVEVFFPK